jgi:hypothetical protein
MLFIDMFTTAQSGLAYKLVIFWLFEQIHSKPTTEVQTRQRRFVEEYSSTSTSKLSVCELKILYNKIQERLRADGHAKLAICMCRKNEKEFAFSFLLPSFAFQLNCSVRIHDLGWSYLQENLSCSDFSVFYVSSVMEGFYAS